jgi:hypothetical protein
MLLTLGKTAKFCWICGKDISLDYTQVDEHGCEVHQACHAQKIMLETASEQLKALRSAKLNPAA